MRAEFCHPISTHDGEVVSIRTPEATSLGSLLNGTRSAAEAL